MLFSCDLKWIRVKMQKKKKRSTMVCFSVQTFDGSRGRCLNTRPQAACSNRPTFRVIQRMFEHRKPWLIPIFYFGCDEFRLHGLCYADYLRNAYKRHKEGTICKDQELVQSVADSHRKYYNKPDTKTNKHVFWSREEIGCGSQ